MKLVSFDALRTLKFPAHTYLKPELFLQHQEEIKAADFVLFPEYWQLSSLLFGLHARIFPSLASYLIGHNKIEMTRVFQTVAPQHHPHTLIEANTAESAQRVFAHMPLPFVAKNPKASMGNGVFLIDNLSDWRRYCAQTDVLYAQEYLPIDRDLRLVVVGEKVVGGYWRLQSENGFHNNIAQGGTVLAGPIPEAARLLVENLAARLHIDHAGFDVAMVGDHPYLFEFNRLFGTQGIEALIGDITPHIIDYLRGQLDSFPGKPRSPSGNTGRRRVRRAA